jgi:protein-tyrosine phosphatase
MTGRLHILFVCTGNICRSPMAQAMLLQGLREGLDPVDGSEWFSVESAGTYGLVGEPMQPDAMRVLDEMGVTAEAFAARELAAEHVADADLVLALTRQHRAAVVTLVPAASSRAFTLREFARLLAGVDPASLPTHVGRADRARVLVAAAAGNRGYVRADAPEDDDVADPYRRPLRAYREAGAQIGAAVKVVVDALLAGTGDRRSQ